MTGWSLVLGILIGIPMLILCYGGICQLPVAGLMKLRRDGFMNFLKLFTLWCFATHVFIAAVLKIFVREETWEHICPWLLQTFVCSLAACFAAGVLWRLCCRLRELFGALLRRTNSKSVSTQS